MLLLLVETQLCLELHSRQWLPSCFLVSLDQHQYLTSVMLSMTLTALVLLFANADFVSAQAIEAKILLYHKFFMDLLIV